MSWLWCQMVIEGLMASGIRELVVSPGSRSTPLLLAAIESELVLHSVIDERSAGFYALGRARGSGDPVALLCTSGSAVSHYLPAFLEAAYAGHKLVALSADRPPNLQDCGANQTIRQGDILRAACGPCIDLGLPDESLAGLSGARRRVYQACALEASPVHINLPFRKPLEPTEVERNAVRPSELRPLPPIVPPRPTMDMAAAMDLLDRCRQAERPLILCGPMMGEELADPLLQLAARWSAPLLCESTSGVRFTGEKHELRMDAFGHLLRSPLRAELEPDVVLAFGDAPVSAPLLRWLDQLSCDSVQICQRRYVNPGEIHNAVFFADPARLATMFGKVLEASSATRDYAERWREADARAWTAVESELPSHSEAQAIRTLVDALPPHTQITIGNSMPIRAIDELCAGESRALRFLHQRGTSGIDGLVAGAIGSSTNELTVLLLGDVSFQHDLSSLALSTLCRGPLLIAVLDNGGGQIFSHLPAADLGLSEEDWQLWSTPPSQSLWKQTEAAAPDYAEASSAKGIRDAVAQATERDGITVLRIHCGSGSLRDFQSKVSEALG